MGYWLLILADAIQLPVDAIQLPADAIRLPADAIRLPADAIRLPADAIRLPADAINRVPTFSRNKLRLKRLTIYCLKICINSVYHHRSFNGNLLSESKRLLDSLSML